MQVAMTIRALEEDVLKSRDPDINDSDDWPLYTLRKTKVLSKETGELVSLLTAHADNPVTVLGTLEAINSDLVDNSEGTFRVIGLRLTG